MKFTETPLQGAYLITPELLADERGFFARSFCRHEFADHGLNVDFVQCNISFNRMKGTLRGMHYQTSPHEEVKLVRCTAGAIYDVIIDPCRIAYLHEVVCRGIDSGESHAALYSRTVWPWFPDPL